MENNQYQQNSFTPQQNMSLIANQPGSSLNGEGLQDTNKNAAYLSQQHPQRDIPQSPTLISHQINMGSMHVLGSSADRMMASQEESQQQQIHSQYNQKQNTLNPEELNRNMEGIDEDNDYKQQKKRPRTTSKPKSLVQRLRRQMQKNYDREWDHNFHVTHSKDNHAFHPHYKEFFDKPPGKKDERLAINIIKLTNNSFDKEFEKVTQESRMPLYTSACGIKHYKNEIKWKSDFSVMASKNNTQVHSNFKEFYDRPIRLNRNGYLYSEKVPERIVYHPITPLRSIRQAKNIKKCTLETSQLSEIKSFPKEFRLRSVDIYNELSFIPNLRSEKAKSRKIKRKEVGWNDYDLGLPISTYNEKVHKTYRVGFERIAKTNGL
ncbi:UNKNOWN [Stylonychia lemnae]|uniref:Uncharacterized protein n=1 Tax=Stylonychia lemnae TaxID=5949 RepID=A0A078A871_STYLE|nr:UNKNOWN [Stylonychia lemnae]|eukprot:CDW78066.1 UNKNOWN [Stylonychia lemnae]